MKTIAILGLLLSLAWTQVGAVDVIVKELKTFQIEIRATVAPNANVAAKKIRNYMANKGYIVENISVVQQGNATTPWIVKVECSFNIEDFRGMSANDVQERLKDSPDIPNITLEE